MSRAAFMASLLLAVPALATSENCGNTAYDPTVSVCYNTTTSAGSQLCPIVMGTPDLLCGTSCYDAYMYKCNNGYLATIQSAPGAFTLTAENPTAPFHGLTIQAAGQAFYVGTGVSSPATYCPEPAAECPAGTSTVMYNVNMAVEVPGGQNIYVKTNGALTYTEAHSTEEPDYYTSAMNALDGASGGAYFGPAYISWMACPAAGQEGVWQVFADLPNLSFASNCTGFHAALHNTQGLGAWQYM